MIIYILFIFINLVYILNMVFIQLIILYLLFIFLYSKMLSNSYKSWQTSANINLNTSHIYEYTTIANSYPNDNTNISNYNILNY